MRNALDILLPYEWRSIGFPCMNFEVELSQDHVEHKWPDRDGAHIEGVGRNPLVFTAKIPMRNGVKPGPNETFVQGTLYPKVYLKFLGACADRTSGFLRHPELGLVRVKCKSAKTHWDANKRDGVDIDVTWVESTDRSLTDIIDDASPTSAAKADAAALDAAIGDYVAGAIGQAFVDSGPIIRPPKGLPNVSFSNLMNTITGAFDSATLITKQIAGKIDEVGYRLDVLSASVDRLRNVQAWPVRQSIERLRSSLNKMRTTLLVATQPISIYTVQKDATLAAISAYIGSPISELINLNTGMFLGPVVRRGTFIRYYTNLNDDSKRNIFDRGTK